MNLYSYFKKHIVRWEFKAGLNKEETYSTMEKLFGRLPENVDGLLELELLKGYQGYDACLITPC